MFLFHCGRFFDTEGWHVKSARTSEAVSFLTVIVAVQWMMPLFFVLSGIGAYYSLRDPRVGDNSSVRGSSGWPCRCCSGSSS